MNSLPTSLVGFTPFRNVPALEAGKVAYMVVTKADVPVWDFDQSAAWDTQIANGNVLAIIPCRGNLAAGTTATKQASGTRQSQNTGTDFSHPIVIDGISSNQRIINAITQPFANYGVILVFKDFTAMVPLNKDSSRIIPVRYDFNNQSEAGENSTREAAGTVNYSSLYKEQFVDVPQAVFLRPQPIDTLAVVSGSIQNDEFTLEWLNQDEATSYALDISTSSTFATFVTGYNAKVIVKQSGAKTTTVVDGLSTATTYYARVRAVNSYGTSVNVFSISQATL